MNENHKPAFTHLQMEAALCIWEDLLERHMNHDREEDDPRGPPIYVSPEAEEFARGLSTFWNDNGTVEMRHLAINMSARAVEDFAALEAAIGRDEIFETWGAYDWEWIPAWVYATVDFSSGHLLLRDSGTVVQGMIWEYYSTGCDVSFWRAAVANGATVLGFDQWRDQQVEARMKQGHVGL